MSRAALPVFSLLLLVHTFTLVIELQTIAFPSPILSNQQISLALGGLQALESREGGSPATIQAWREAYKTNFSLEHLPDKGWDWYQFKLVATVWRAHRNSSSEVAQRNSSSEVAQRNISLEVAQRNSSSEAEIEGFLEEVAGQNFILAWPSALVALSLGVSCIFLLYGVREDEPGFLRPCLIIWPIAAVVRITCIVVMSGEHGFFHPAVLVRNIAFLTETLFHALAWPAVFLKVYSCTQTLPEEQLSENLVNLCS